mmetsp:Transcript_24674/g.50000  ORF Transcript_24674/g.50000 Transcript_24674/m.50000 type:complete len:119 (+) Transcript_24674:149-505(+)
MYVEPISCKCSTFGMRHGKCMKARFNTKPFDIAKEKRIITEYRSLWIMKGIKDWKVLHARNKGKNKNLARDAINIFVEKFSIKSVATIPAMILPIKSPILKMTNNVGVNKSFCNRFSL